MKNNRYSRALRVLKSTEVDDKIKSLNEMPTNHTKGLYSLNDPGFRVGQKDPQKVYYPDVDGNWPAGIPGTPGELEYVRPEGYWSGGSDWDTQVSTDFSQDYLLNDPTGRSTSGLISDNGTVFSELPPNSEGFILGPVVDGFVPNHTSDAYTNIGYIQKDTRQFVLLARVQGQWKSNLNGNYPVWGGTSTGFTSYNQNFTLEMAQWVRDKILNDKYTSKVPYFYSGGVPQVPQSPADCPNCPPGMYGGNGIGPRQFGSGGNPSIGDQQGPPKSGDAKDAGFPWELFGKIGDKIKDLLGGAAKTVSGVLYNIQQAPINVLEYVFSNTPQEMIADAIQVTGQIIGLESAANMLNAYQSFLGNPNSAGSSPSNPYNATNDISTADMKLLSNNIYRDSSITELFNGLQKGSYSSEKVTLRGFGRFSEVEVKTSILESKVSNAVSNAVSESRGLDNSLHNNVQANIQKSVEKGEIVLTKEYVFRPGGSVEASEKTIVGQVLSALGVELDTAGGSGLVYLGFAAAALGLSNSKQYGGLYKSPGMHYEITVPKPSNIKESKEVLSENRQRILRDIKKPYVLPEVPKQKYKMNFAGKHSAQNTPDKTASKLSDDLVASGNARGQKWRLQDKYWQGYETTERMNVIYDRVGHGDQYFERIIGENQRKVSWKNKEIQEHLNIIAHEKAMKEENPNYESPFYKTIQEQETIEADKDPLLKKVYKKLKKEIDYPDKPSKNGDPNDPPPEMVNGYHPNFGKKVNYYKKLDPDSANSMPETGDPEIDAEVKKAKKVKEEKKSDWRTSLKEQKDEYFRRGKLNEQMTTSDVFYTTLPATGDVDLLSPSLSSTAGNNYNNDGATITIGGDPSPYSSNGVLLVFDARQYDTLKFNVNIPPGAMIQFLDPSKPTLTSFLTVTASGTYTLTIPSDLRKSNFQLILNTPDSVTMSVSNFTFQRRTPISVFVPLNSPEATSFIRTDPNFSNLSPEERNKKLKEMIESGDEYLTKMFGSNFPGTGAVPPGESGDISGVQIKDIPYQQPTTFTMGYDVVTDAGTQKATYTGTLKTDSEYQKELSAYEKAIAADKQKADELSKAVDAARAEYLKPGQTVAQRQQSYDKLQAAIKAGTDHALSTLKNPIIPPTPQTQTPQKPLSPQQLVDIDKQIKDLQAQSEKNKQDAQINQWKAAGELALGVAGVVGGVGALTKIPAAIRTAQTVSQVRQATKAYDTFKAIEKIKDAAATRQMTRPGTYTAKPNPSRTPVKGGMMYKNSYEPQGEVISEKRKLKSPEEVLNKIPGYYTGKPAPLGFPETPPPEMVNGMHPDLVDGKKVSDRFNRLDPESAKATPLTGNPHIDKKIKAARKKPK